VTADDDGILQSMNTIAATCNRSRGGTAARSWLPDIWRSKASPPGCSLRNGVTSNTIFSSLM
jgi:hypothetical protein